MGRCLFDNCILLITTHFDFQESLASECLMALIPRNQKPNLASINYMKFRRYYYVKGFPTIVSYNKYWNWCRCIQRKDSAGVILTASWFNDINIGYRFHFSTVCHSCCNNVMYFSKENLDISGSAWKKYHAGMAFLPARIVLVLKNRARAVFAPCKHQQPDYGPVLAYYLWHILIFALYKYDSNKCIQ